MLLFSGALLNGTQFSILQFLFYFIFLFFLRCRVDTINTWKYSIFKQKNKAHDTIAPEALTPAIRRNKLEIYRYFHFLKRSCIVPQKTSLQKNLSISICIYIAQIFLPQDNFSNQTQQSTGTKFIVIFLLEAPSKTTVLMALS